MAVTGKLRKGTCKLCGKTVRRRTAGEVISAIHAHYVKAHPASLSRRIKKGMRKRRSSGGSAGIRIDTQGNSLWNPSWVGFAEKKVIEKTTGMKYDEVKEKVVDFMVQLVLGGVTKPKA